MEKDTVAISFVRDAVAGLRLRGQDVRHLLQAVNIPESLLAVDQARVSAERFSALWLAVAAALDDEFFDLDSRRMKVGSFAALCHFMIGARSLRGALQRAIRLLDIILDDSLLRLEEDGTVAALRIAPSPRAIAAQRPIRPFAHETLLILVHGLMCWLVGRRIAIERAEFAYPRPARWREYTVMYAQELAFDCDRTRIRFGAELLDASVVQDEASAREFLREAPYNIVLKYKDQHSWSARVRHELRDAEPQEWPGFESLATQLGVSSSVLRRGLAREGGSFRAIKDALRRDMAIEQLSHTGRTMPEIALAVGFTEPSAFHRAFKQWTGVRPGEYRRQQGRRGAA